MVKLLYDRYLGQIARCNQGCGAIIGYGPEDVGTERIVSDIICPKCKMVLWVPFNPEYDGVIKESEEKKNEKSVV